jgi:DNA-binding MarR family transcriptional regulator
MSQARHHRHDLDEALSNGVRLSIVAALQAVERAEFALVRDSVEITDSALSKQCALLEAVGYVEVTKGRIGRKPRTWLALTAAGRQALARHLAALQAIADQPMAEASQSR